MEVRHLRYFVTVAEELSFTRAAARLFTVQSTVSAAIRALEDELQVRLFDRSTRRVALSPAGAAFLVEARAVIEAAERARVVASEAAKTLRGTLRVGSLIGCDVIDLPGLIEAFQARHPLVDVQVRVSESGSLGMAEEVRRGRLDVGLVGVDAADAPGLVLHPFATFPYVVLLPAGHRLENRADLGLADLAVESFVDSPPGYGTRVALDRAFARQGMARHTQIEISDIRTAASYVRALSAVSVMPDFGIPGDDAEGVVTRPLAPELTMTLSLAVAVGRPLDRRIESLLTLVDDHVRAGAIT